MQSPIPSPCTSVCAMDPALAYCRGCARTIAEIAAWASMPDDDKALVWQRLPARRIELGARYTPGPGAQPDLEARRA